MHSSSLLLLPLLLTLSLSLLPSSPHALLFQLPSGRVKCLIDDLSAGAVSVARYRLGPTDDGVPPAAGQNISARVSDPKGDSLHWAEGVEAGEFAFVAEETGRYSVCFWSPQFRLSASVSVDFEWNAGFTARPGTAVAKKGKVDLMEMELKKLEDTINSIHEEMMFLRQRDVEAQRLNEATASRIGLLSLLSVAVCMGVAGLQLWHLKTFFEREKIL